MSDPDNGVPGQISASFREITHAPKRGYSGDSAPPFSLRLTFEERARLERDAGGMPWGAYIRSRIFDGAPSKRRRRTKRPVKDQQALAKVLAELGKARLANNLNQLAKAVHTGSLPVTPDTEKAIREACAEVYWLRKTLMEALGSRG